MEQSLFLFTSKLFEFESLTMDVSIKMSMPSQMAFLKLVQKYEVPSIFFLRALKTLYFHFCNFIRNKNNKLKGFVQNSLHTNIYIIASVLKPNCFKEEGFFDIIFLPKKVIIEVQSGNRVFNWLVPCIKCMELAC